MQSVVLKAPLPEPGNVWETTFKKLSIRDVNRTPLAGVVLDGEARVRLITRSGFEQKHIFTSQIASG